MTIRNFEELSEKCPWRSYLKCEILHSAGNYGNDGCTKDNCAFMYWEGVKEKQADGEDWEK